MTRTTLSPHDEIRPDTPVRLSVAAALAFPDGSMTASGLRRERARGRLVVERIAGKDYTTLANIERMRELCRVQAEARQIPTRRHDREAQEQGPARRPRRTSPHFNRRGSESGLCALDNRCAHMGFPLDRGSIEDGF
jgi:hypothetical protein